MQTGTLKFVKMEIAYSFLCRFLRPQDAYAPFCCTLFMKVLILRPDCTLHPDGG